MRKHLHALCAIASVIVLSTSLQAQTETKVNHSVQIRILSVDYKLSNTALNAPNSLFIPNGVEFSYTNTINDRFAFSLPFKYHRASLSESQSSKSVYNIDALAKYLFSKPERNLTPYLMVGGGLAYEEEVGTHVQIPVGFGLNYMIGSHSMLSLESQYRYSMVDLRNNVQIALGVSFSVGKVVLGELASDPLEYTPEDVVVEDEEVKPVFVNQRELIEASLIEEEKETMQESDYSEMIEDLDSDGDGVMDSKDACPDLYGPPEKDGCPLLDADKDGIEDPDDACPTVAGLIALNGCPDSDGDGVKDSEDLCPEVAGTIDGCPEADDDMDGIPNSADKCPNMPGDLAHSGCPEMEKEEKNMLKLAAENIQFEFGKAHLKAISYETLDKIVDLLKKYPEFELEIVGHTDDVGRKQSNLELSLDRATSCKDYLISRKIDAMRIKVLAEGELKPLDSNRTETGRELNRRVEFIVIGQ